MYDNCELCFRKCGADRVKGEKGFCGAGTEPIVHSYAPHYGEEPPISGTRGSGTIFFSRCCMNCVYCQNFTFSRHDAGREVSAKRLGEMMLELEARACHNINLVSPTHYVPSILEALKCASLMGLKLPIVYNTGGYDSLETIKSLSGIVDIYLPDMRYSSDAMSEEYSKAPGYVKNNRDIVKEMYKQAGNLKLFEGIAIKGLIIRLLVLPENISGTISTLEFIADEIGTSVALSVMSQYYPAYKAVSYEGINRRITEGEYKAVVDKVHSLGFDNGWIQPFGGNFDSRFAGENFKSNV